MSGTHCSAWLTNVMISVTLADKYLELGQFLAKVSMGITKIFISVCVNIHGDAYMGFSEAKVFISCNCKN